MVVLPTRKYRQANGFVFSTYLHHTIRLGVATRLALEFSRQCLFSRSQTFDGKQAGVPGRADLGRSVPLLRHQDTIYESVGSCGGARGGTAPDGALGGPVGHIPPVG